MLEIRIDWKNDTERANGEVVDMTSTVVTFRNTKKETQKYQKQAKIFKKFFHHSVAKNILYQILYEINSN